jgi:ribonuclease G
MSAELLINVTPAETRIALIENGALQEVFIERNKRRGLVGNICKGKVSRVLPGMQAAFVDIGLERAAFLHASDVSAPTPSHQPKVENSTCSRDSIHRGGPTRSNDNNHDHGPIENITELLREGQEVLVQVIKDPIGTKGARLTTHISIPSCYLVYMPNSDTVGVSQRIEDDQERQRLRQIIRGYLYQPAATHATPTTADPGTRASEEPGASSLPEAMPVGSGQAPIPYEKVIPGGYIVRTAAEHAAQEVLQADMSFLRKLWLSLTERAKQTEAPCTVHQDLPVVIRTMRELIGTELEAVHIDAHDMYRQVIDFTYTFTPEMTSRIRYYTGERPIFDLYGVEDEIQKALERKVQLKSGGYLIIDQTEAMTTIDVNTGAYVGHRNLEETIFKTNLEAAQAIARQLRLRNLGGIIIIDFIDMEPEEHKRQVLRALEKSLERDHTKTHISEVSSLGLVQMTRKRTRESLEHILCEPCPMCGGRGSLKTPETVCYEIFREIVREARQYEPEKLLVLASQEIVDMLMDEESASFAELESLIGKPIKLQVESLYTQEQFDVVLM